MLDMETEKVVEDSLNNSSQVRLLHPFSNFQYSKCVCSVMALTSFLPSLM